ncbi:MAG: hypothetical protein ACI9J3_002083 [Parvicellaceae bacterium]|jgi:hypothetical protein
MKPKPSIMVIRLNLILTCILIFTLSAKAQNPALVVDLEQDSLDYDWEIIGISQNYLVARNLSSSDEPKLVYLDSNSNVIHAQKYPGLDIWSFHGFANDTIGFIGYTLDSILLPRIGLLNSKGEMFASTSLDSLAPYQIIKNTVNSYWVYSRDIAYNIHRYNIDLSGNIIEKEKLETSCVFGLNNFNDGLLVGTYADTIQIIGPNGLPKWIKSYSSVEFGTFSPHNLTKLANGSYVALERREGPVSPPLDSLGLQLFKFDSLGNLVKGIFLRHTIPEWFPLFRINSVGNYIVLNCLRPINYPYGSSLIREGIIVLDENLEMVKAEVLYAESSAGYPLVFNFPGRYVNLNNDLFRIMTWQANTAIFGYEYTLKRFDSENLSYCYGSKNVTSDYEIVELSISESTISLTPAKTNSPYSYPVQSEASIAVTDIVLSEKCNSVELSEVDAPVNPIVYPNPSSTVLNIKIESGKIETLFVYTAYGKLIKSVSSQQQEIQLDVSDLSNGMYLLSILSADGQTGTNKFVVQH